MIWGFFSGNAASKNCTSLRAFRVDHAQPRACWLPFPHVALLFSNVLAQYVTCYFDFLLSMLCYPFFVLFSQLRVVSLVFVYF